MEVLDRFDEMALPEHEVEPLGVVDRHYLQFHAPILPRIADRAAQSRGAGTGGPVVAASVRLVQADDPY